jgi:amidase
MPFFGQELFLQAQKKGPLTEAAYKRALTTCRNRSRSMGIDQPAQPAQARLAGAFFSGS